MLPSRDSVHAADLVNRALQSADPPGSADPASEPAAMLVTTPWNDETLLLWVAVPSAMIADMTALSVEFDPKTVATFRPLGNPSALPVPAAIPGWYGRAAMLYELSLQPDIRQPKSNAAALALKYGTIHVSGAALGPPKIDRTITYTDLAGGIDNVPDPFQFAVAVAGFGGLLRGDPALRDLSCNDIIALAESAALPDPDGWHGQMIAVMRRAEPLIDLPPK
jgi:Ca-activated chloride channel family protein